MYVCMYVLPTCEHKWVGPIPHEYVGHYCEVGNYAKLSPLAVGTFSTLLASIVFC